MGAMMQARSTPSRFILRQSSSNARSNAWKGKHHQLNNALYSLLLAILAELPMLKAHESRSMGIEKRIGKDALWQSRLQAKHVSCNVESRVFEERL